ncbi:MAG: hypothetical protein WBE85_06635, partial [Methylocella sp.]
MPHVRFIGLDVHKKKIAVAIAEEGRNGEVLSCGSIDNTKAALAKLLQKLGKESATLHLCYRGIAFEKGLTKAAGLAGNSLMESTDSRENHASGDDDGSVCCV